MHRSSASHLLTSLFGILMLSGCFMNHDCWDSADKLCHDFVQEFLCIFIEQTTELTWLQA